MLRPLRFSACLFVSLLTVTAFLVACDASGPDDPPEPRFEAKITGAIQKTLRGPAGLASGTEAGDAFAGLFGVLPPATDSLILPLPDSLDEAPLDSLRPSGTILFLRDEDASPFGSGISVFIRGDGPPAPGTYAFQTFALGPDALPLRRPAVEAFASYTELEDDTFRIAPAAQGSVTVEASGADLLRGRFAFATLLALELRAPVPGDTTFAGLLEPQPFQTSIAGTFTATRAAAAFPLLLDSMAR